MVLLCFSFFYLVVTSLRCEGAVPATALRGGGGVMESKESSSLSFCPWHRRGASIYGSRPSTESGTSVALSENGKMLAIEEYGNANGPYKQNGHGTGRLRILAWNDTAMEYQEEAVFTEGLSTDMQMTHDGIMVSTIGFNPANNGMDSEIDWIIHVYQRSTAGDQPSWRPRGPALSKSHGLSYYPFNHALSRDGNSLAISGGLNGGDNMEEWTSIHEVYRFVDTGDSSQGDGTYAKVGQGVVVGGGVGVGWIPNQPSHQTDCNA